MRSTIRELIRRPISPIRRRCFVGDDDFFGCEIAYFDGPSENVQSPKGAPHDYSR
jgi:hypothetical protein